MHYISRIRTILILTLTLIAFLMSGTSVFAETLRLGNGDPWKHGKIVGSYVKVLYGSSAPSGKVPATITISSKSVVVTANSLNVRSGPGTSYSLVGSVSGGAVLKYLMESDGWYNVVLSDGRTGWVSAAYVKLQSNNQDPVTPPVQQPEPEPGQEVDKRAIVKGDVVNVRSGPGTNFSIITKVSVGTTLIVTRETVDWYKVRTTDGKEGWVSASLVQIQSPPPSRGDSPPANPPSGDPTNPGTGQEPAGPSIKVNNVKTESDFDFERIIISTDGTVNYSVYVLSNPNRLVFDLMNAENNSPQSLFEGLNNWVAGVRVSQFSSEPKIVRVVVDLKSTVSYKATLSEDGKDLIVDLKAPSIDGKLIVIDAGHGGTDPGAVGVTGLKEKDFNLDTAKRLEKLLTEMGANVVMTRTEDVFVSLNDRALRANNLGADLFISIHANSSEVSTTNGTSTYYYAPSTIPSLHAQADARKRLAGKVQAQLAANLGIKDLGIRQGNFAVLRNTKMPSILVEAAFLSHPAEEALLRDSDFRDKVAQSVAQGIVDYFSAL